MHEIKILSEQEIQEELKRLPGWKYDLGRLVKTFEFKNFMDVIHLVDQLALLFEKLNHHADMKIEHRKITFKLWRFDIGMQVTNLDVIVAKEIEKLSKEYPMKKTNLQT